MLAAGFFVSCRATRRFARHLSRFSLHNFAPYLLASSPAVLYTCKAGGDYGGTYVSENIQELLGYRPEEYLENSGFWQEHLHPDDLDRVLAGLEEVFSKGHHVCEYRFRAKSGEYLWMRDELRLARNPATGSDELIGSWLDITERKRAEEALRDSEAFLREASQLARLGRWRWHVRTNEAEWSTVTLEIFGLEPSGRGITYADFINAVHPDDRSAVEAALREALENGRDYAVEHRILLPDGALRHVQEKGRVHYGDDGQPVSMVGTVLDVTEQKLVEERLRESDRIKNEFIATASHELRTPLAIIQGYSEVMLENADLVAEQQREFLAVIHDKALALEKIVADLLDVSRIETGRMICLEFGEVDVVEEIRQVVNQFQQEATSHRFSLALPAEAINLSIDRLKIVQVLENLLSNAVKFSPKGSEIVVTAAVLGDCFRVMVADQGRGITVEEQRQIFDKFYRADTSNTAVAGLGLGLYLVRKIIESHRGRVWLESVPGQGSQFYFCLPLPGCSQQAPASC